MQNDKELMLRVIEEQKNCGFSLRFMLHKDDGRWKNVFAVLKLVKTGTRNEVEHNYGEYVLVEKLLNIEHGLNIISSLNGENGEKGKFVIPEYDEFTIMSRQRLDFAPSKCKYGILKSSSTPIRFCSYRVLQDEVSSEWNRELLKEGVPYYPDVSQAVIDFFDLAIEHFNSYGEVYVIVADHRAQIKSMRLLLSKVKLELHSPEIEVKNLVIKVFAKSGVKIVTLPDIVPESETVEFDVGFQPDSLSVALVTRGDNMKIDVKRFTKWTTEEEGITIERPEEEILSLTKAGESQNLEYKYDVTAKDPKNDFIESVVAFLNTNRGTILIGVDDKGNVVGSKKRAEDIQKIIHDSCDPPPMGVRTEEREVSGSTIIVVEVPEGDEKPYQSKRDKIWYVRHNANDMRMERSELISIFQRRDEQSGGKFQ